MSSSSFLPLKMRLQIASTFKARQKASQEILSSFTNANRISKIPQALEPIKHSSRPKAQK
jgi:hypothetical protein